MKQIYLPVALLTFLISGCIKEEETVTEAPQEVVEFTGAPDAKYAGVWQSKGGQSTLELKADGAGKSKTDVATRGGQQKSEETFEWKIDGTKLLMKFGSGKTTRYFFKMPDASTLEMRGAEKSSIVNTYKLQK